MTNDTTTLNGALQELGETLATNLNNKGVNANASDGLTTLANKINQIYTGECYFIDSLDTSDYILRDTSTGTITIDNSSIKISNSTTSNQSILFTLNRGPIIGNWKITYELKTNGQITLYQRIAGSRTGNVATVQNNINLSEFTQVEWTFYQTNMTVKINNETIGNTTATDNMYYPIFGFYFNQNEYVLIKNLKIIKI